MITFIGRPQMENQSLLPCDGPAGKKPKTQYPKDALNYYRLVFITNRRTGKGYISQGRIVRDGIYHKIVIKTDSFRQEFRGGSLIALPERIEASKRNKYGENLIEDLVILPEPDPRVNLFRTVPKNWVEDRSMLNDAAKLFDAMPSPYRQLYNAIFWEEKRFRTYCETPSSIKNHHAFATGNLAHSLEVARLMLLSGLLDNPGFSIILALLHDCAKASEYTKNRHGNLEMSDQGRLIGHRIMLVQWITEAITRYKIPDLPDPHIWAIIHCLTASPNLQYLGIRAPSMPEAVILSGMDRISGQINMLLQNQKTEGWGRYVESLKATPFKFPALAQVSTRE